MMLGADIRFCAPDTDISVMEMRWGLIPDVAGTALLRGLVREDRLREIIFTGRRYTGTEAFEIGLVTHQAAAPHAEAMAMARAIADSSPDAMRAAKRLLNLPWAISDGDLLLAESREQEVLLASDNHAEAVRAGRDKRAPIFKN